MCVCVSVCVWIPKCVCVCVCVCVCQCVCAVTSLLSVCSVWACHSTLESTMQLVVPFSVSCVFGGDGVLLCRTGPHGRSLHELCLPHLPQQDQLPVWYAAFIPSHPHTLTPSPSPDTTFMFVLSALGLYQLLVARSPDCRAGMHHITLLLAAIILVVVVGVVSGSCEPTLHNPTPSSGVLGQCSVLCAVLRAVPGGQPAVAAALVLSLAAGCFSLSLEGLLPPPLPTQPAQTDCESSYSHC